MKHRDYVKRIVKEQYGIKHTIYVQRLICKQCGSLHRELPDNLVPYKQYDAEIIFGVVEHLITTDTLGYEESPCEMTMARWVSQKNRSL